MRSHKSSYVHPPYKTKCRVENWAEYEKGLRDRGDVAIWLSEAAIDAWTPTGNGRRGGQQLYSDLAIETALTFRIVFHLALRQTEGFVGSLLKVMGLDLAAPEHTTLSRRGSKLEVALRRELPAGPIYLIVDSTGLKIMGQGQWAAAKHGTKGTRAWRKLHVGVDANGIIVAEQLTDSTVDDSTVVEGLLDQVETEIERFTADGAYDTWSIREALAARGATVVVPPSKKAVTSGRGTPASRARDAAIARIKEVGRRQWKKEVGYHQQGRAENTFFRYQQILGSRLRSRDPGARKVEVRLGCNVLNEMLELGAAKSVAIGR